MSLFKANSVTVERVHGNGSNTTIGWGEPLWLATAREDEASKE
jgi:hypothetical protein